MQRPLPAMAPQLVRASNGHRVAPHSAVSDAVTEPAECKKAMSVVPVIGRMPVAPRYVAHAPPLPVAVQAPVAMPQQAPVPKIQPALQRLPRFRPPVFEDADGILPLPDSPGSTPRDGDDARERQSREQSSRVSDSDAYKRSIARHMEPEPEQPAAESTGIYAAGTFVEYKSRSSGLWILARVEGYDESSQTYRLDVQPHAHPSRVRPRGARKAQTEANHEPDFSNAELQAAAGDQDKNEGEKQLPRATTVAMNDLMAPAAGPAMSQQRLQEQASLQPQSPSAQEVGILGHYADNVEQEEYKFSSADVKQLIMEAMRLKERVTQMQADISVLQDRVMQEAALKDRYFVELCLCREQLQRVRSTPR